MRLIPVLDLMNGEVVHAVAGERNRYHPICSEIVTGSDPLHVARALFMSCQPREMYLADLDAITQGREPAWEVFEAIRSLGVALWVDAGWQPHQWRADAVDGMILGLESLRQFDDLRAMLAHVDDPDRVIFSLDLRAGQPLSDWGTPLDIVQMVREVGIHRLIVLDLAAVGTGRGVPTRSLCRAIKTRWPMMEVITGGGVRHRNDVEELAEWGVDAVLVASALHRREWYQSRE